MEASTEEQFQEVWGTIVQEYSGSQLTFESDRLVTLSGVVSVIRKHRNYRNYAGLWDKSLVEDLLWIVDDPQPRGNSLIEHLTKDRIRYGFPTWSWVSMQGKML